MTLNIVAFQLYAQTSTVNVTMQNVSLHEILQEIKKQTGQDIIYNNNLIERFDNESFDLQNIALEKALSIILQGKELSFSIVDGLIIIEPEKQPQKPDRKKSYYQNIKGTVYDIETNTPLIGATILIIDSQPITGTATDLQGRFILTKVPIGRCNIEVTYIGYKPLILSEINITSGKEVVLNVGLKQSVTTMNEITISPSYQKDKALNPMATVSARSFTIEETERFAGSLGDPARMATNYAGVSTAGDQRNDIIIRGNSPSGLLWQLEGIPIPSPNHFDVLGTTGGPVGMLNNNLLSRSDFFTSTFPAEYGNASSGVFDLNMRNGNNTKHEFIAQLGFNGFEAGAEGPLSKKHNASYIVNARYSMLGLVKDLLWVDGLPEYKDVSFKVNFPLEKGKISVFGLGGFSSIIATEEDESRTNANNEYAVKSINGSRTGIIGANHSYRFTPNIVLKTTIGYSTRQPHEQADSVINNDAYLRLDENSYIQNNLTLSTKLKTKLNAKNTTSLGVIIQNMSFEAERMSSDVSNSIVTIDKPYTISQSNLILSQAYFQWKHNFSDNLYFNAGVNALYFHYNATSAIDPRIGFSWNCTEKQSFGIGYGLHSQMQAINTYFIQTPIGTDTNNRQVYFDLGTNKNLDFTRNNQFAISHNYLISRNFRIKTELYYQYLFNVPVHETKGYFSMINTGAAMSIPEQDYLVNKGYGKNYGLEITIEKFLSDNYYFLITGSLFNSLYQGSDKVWRNTAYNGNYVFNALAGYEYELKENIRLNTNIRTVFAGGRRITPFDLERSIAENENKYDYDKAFEKQVAPYFRFDLRIGILFQKEKTSHEFAIDIANLTNHKNVYKEKFNPETGKTKTSYHQGIFPMGLYRFHF